MRKIIYILVLLLVIFIIAIYGSLWSTPKEKNNCSIPDVDDMSKINFRDYDSILVAASTLYEANELKMLMQGEQYREAWSQPVKVPIVFLDTLFGGMSILKEGGGKQTHSLKMASKNGVIYTLRSINKDPEPLVPEFAVSLGLENIVIDGISAQHPYGAILSAELSNKAQILHTNPKVVFVPKQKALDKYNNNYGNRLYLLEYETEGDINWTDYTNITELLDTEDLQELKLELKNNLSIDISALIRSRLFDFLIGDWDRHTKQWGWAIQKEANGRYVAIPIPGDRDNAFFKSDGLIPSILNNKNVIPEMRPFEKDIDFLEGLVYPFDRYFLLNVEEELFVAEAKKLQELLSDEAIEESLKVWPKTIVDLDGELITDKIKSRRERLLDYAKGFKEIIDKKGILTEPLKGSDDAKISASLIACFECE